MHVPVAYALASIVLGAIAGCDALSSAAGLERRVLPAPSRDGGASLTHVLATRRTVRAFRTTPPGDTELGQLLWAAQGTSDGHRTAPSAGALYPLTIYVIDEHGVWRYVPAAHAIDRVVSADRREAVAHACLDQEAVADAPIALVIAADISITAHKYGARAERFATLEAGHAAQNVLLTATALDLGAAPIGAFDEPALRRALGLGASLTVLYVIPVGHPR